MNIEQIGRREFLRFLSASTVSLLPLSPAAADAVPRGQWHEFARPLMGSVTAIAVFHRSRDEAGRVVDRCFEYLNSVIAIISDWEEGSITSRLNRERTISAASVEPLFTTFFHDALLVRSAAKSLFEPFSLGMTRLWREARRHNSIPDRSAVAHERRKFEQGGGSASHGALSLFGNGALDAGGFGKGFVADAAAGFLKREGIVFGRIACSGDLRFFGPTEWHVDIEHPREERILGTATLFGDVAISTSGDYRNAWFVNGRRYHHLIDPRTGMPGKKNMSITVTAPTAILADAWATALFFEPAPAAERLLKNNLPAARAASVRADGVIVDNAKLLLRP